MPALLYAGAAAHAQTAPADDCPALPAEAAATLRWETLRIPDMLLCRALAKDGGAETFALTISRESPFRPRRGDRAETGAINGREVQWYRGNIPNEPNLQIREALIRIGDNQVVHVSMRASDADTLARHQALVLSLPFTPAEDD